LRAALASCLLGIGSIALLPDGAPLPQGAWAPPAALAFPGGLPQSAPTLAPERRLLTIRARRHRTRESPAPNKEKEAGAASTQAPSASPPEASAAAGSVRSRARDHKTSAIAPPAADLPAGGEPRTPGEPPAGKPDLWPDAEIIAALGKCVEMLAPLGAEVEVVPPIKKDDCGAPAPVTLRRIGAGSGKVVFDPPVLINCPMVASLGTWVEKILQPAAQESFGVPVTRLRNASGYQCRKRNGSTVNADKLSEHALANAIDIGAFQLADGRMIAVAQFWGPTVRDVREAEKRAAAAGDKQLATEKERFAPGPHRISAIATAGPTLRPSPRPHPGRGSDAASDGSPAPASPGRGESAGGGRSVEGLFLRRLHAGACAVFGTVLGPEANEAHRDHLHFDLAPRRHSAFCQ
jgi:hypothetical protein